MTNRQLSVVAKDRVQHLLPARTRECRADVSRSVRHSALQLLDNRREFSGSPESSQLVAEWLLKRELESEATAPSGRIIAPAARPAHIIASLLALTPGTRLGVYEVTALLGEGGMGQVYRATDTRLKRQVAIKILPPSVAADHDRLARFQREGEVLASLNHPNIAGIYGLEESGGASALVMELVEGEELSAIIARGPIPVAEALPMAQQIAEALEAAHEHAIIHRDLKPANVKVREDGTVKVLDFGLAKAIESIETTGTSASMSPTITSPAVTRLGVILGTAAYMSPEQAKGRAADKRADVWAFGAVLYEILTGRRAFEGEGVSALANVMHVEPAWEALPAGLAPSVVALLRRCLAKDPKKRMRDIGDVGLALDGALTYRAPRRHAFRSACVLR
jgi:eukaryotic-like serine/threonine-protein kinase